MVKLPPGERTRSFPYRRGLAEGSGARRVWGARFGHFVGNRLDHDVTRDDVLRLLEMVLDFGTILPLLPRRR